ncbi:MAG: tetratricopeptide repeat protein [Bacteroidales bacterium]|nr:tetratricopeptide repeat protein [Bacteroidales bacterium]
MEKIFTTIISLLFCSVIVAQSELMQKAEKDYTSGDFKSAITSYEEITQNEGVSSSLYYNLGNAYFKNKQYPQAILNYERSLLLDPSNKDTKFNLKLAQLQTTDKIETVDTFFLTQWFENVRDFMSSNKWAYIAVASFIVTIILLFTYIFSRRIFVRKIGFFGGVLFLVICIFCNVCSFSQKNKLELRENAIVFTPTVTVKGSPADSGTEIFVIHEGTKVKIRNVLGNWSEIELSDGKVGWLPSADIVKI